MKTLVVIAHPRTDSLTWSLTKKMVEGLSHSGHKYEILDLYAENFNPLLQPIDEPDFGNSDKGYSKEVQREMERIKRHDAIIFVFPVWWHSTPAILKGYIDRVFNNGFAYGTNKLPIEKIRWIAIAADSRYGFKKRGYQLMMEHHLNIGIADYVGVPDSEIHFLYNSLGGENVQSNDELTAHFEQLHSDAYAIGKDF
ncbi:NAD(P)H dehydrogenase [Paenibacillus sp. FSL R7-0273]|uniref:NAD(P)H oxidoreductase n=1 Tax=Paenibacillus sp. FSL R7-0273 TaxID=1536772 RepID=UPI0004F93473|nr:NAD(P)H oxidoreductase [Paenibacillus sp. FSL R7-0273]AIQ46485.1 NAD(P)H dehydrogenase [Paenibacillus sp. FSL R7-0273]OMF97752.1 NAD(P)H dehydrogenase [Paenibacillus sp. FSL R7-0273]